MIKQIYRMSKVYVLVKVEEKMHLASRLFISTLDKQRKPPGSISFQSLNARATTTFAPFVAVTGVCYSLNSQF
jgi:hypothetical protein